MLYRLGLACDFFFLYNPKNILLLCNNLRIDVVKLCKIVHAFDRYLHEPQHKKPWMELVSLRNLEKSEEIQPELTKNQA